MSLATFKKKSGATHGSNISGKRPGGTWLNRGLFVNSNVSAGHLGKSGFSLNGGATQHGYVGKTYAFSRQGTPYKGIHAVGHGGYCGTYNTVSPVFLSGNIATRGTQYKYIKPSVLSEQGMLHTKYRWIRRPYPYATVQPVYGSGNLSLNASQGMYIESLTSKNVNYYDINQFDKHDTNVSSMQDTNGCNRPIQSELKLLKTHNSYIFTINKRSYITYSKHLRNAETSSEVLRRKKAPCAKIEVYPRSTNGNSLNAINLNVNQ